MQESFYRTICQIGTFMICAQAILHFRPRESYGKYLKMLLSVMILVQIFQPFSNLFFGNTNRKFQDQIAYFQEEMETRMQDAIESAQLSEQKLQEMTLMEVQERIAEQQERMGEEYKEEAEEKEQENSEEANREKKLEEMSASGLEEDVRPVQGENNGKMDIKIKVELDAAEE